LEVIVLTRHRRRNKRVACGAVGKRWIVSLLGLAAACVLLLGPLSKPSYATFWAGNHYQCWGIKASITTPPTPFYVHGSDYVPSWVSTVAFKKANGEPHYREQIGYTYQPAV
jgi:hypothetical protein